MAGGSLLPPPNSTSANTHLPEIRVVVLGDGLVGKTSFLRQYLDHEGPSSSSSGYEPTLLDSYTHIEYCGKQPYRVHFTDCSSDPEFREHRAAYLAKCDVVVLVFSALHRKTLTSLRNWMKEVVDARTSTGPARFASTSGDFSEVPIFVVGTHYGEKQSGSAVQKLVSVADAEAVTTECLHAAGYFVNEEDADMEEELRLQRAEARKERKPVPKKKQSPRAFRGFFTDLFKGSLGDSDDDNHHHHHGSGGKSGKSKSNDKKESKKAGSSGATDHVKKDELEDGTKAQTRFSPHSRSASQSHTPFASSVERPHGMTEPFGECGPPSEDGSLAALPPGASPRLPLYMLSNKDNEAVNTAVRASLALHLWLKLADDYSTEVSPGVTPLTSPRARSSALLIHEPPSSLSVGGHGANHSGSTPPAELAGLALTPQHGRSISAASHNSHMSERSAASFIPSMHALYGSVTSLSAFDTYHHSRATSSGPLTDGNSPLATGQPTQLLIAAGGSCLVDSSSSPGLDGKTTTEPYPTSSPNVQGRSDRGPLSGSPWKSPTVFSPGQVEELRANSSVTTSSANGGSTSTPPAAPTAGEAAAAAAAAQPHRHHYINSSSGAATPTMRRVPSERSPKELDATANDVTPLQEEQRLVQANTDIFVASPPHPRRATAPNTAMKADGDVHPAEFSILTQTEDYSAPSGRTGGDGTARPLPAWATADTPAPRHSVGKTDGCVTPSHTAVWKDIDAEEHRNGTAGRADGCGSGGADRGSPATDSVVKKLALEHEARSGANSVTTSPQKSPGKSASVTPTNHTPRGSAPIAFHDPHANRSTSHPASGTSSASTLRSPTISPRSREQTHTHSRTPSRTQSHASTPQQQAISRSQTRAPQREHDDLAKSASLSNSLVKGNAQQKQKASQCTSGGCHVM